MSKLEHENKIELLERREVTNYSFSRDGVLFKIKVKPELLTETQNWNSDISKEQRRQKWEVM